MAGNYTAAGVNHGFKWSGGQFVSIDFPGSTITNLTGINSLGEISGVYGIAGSSHGFLLSDGEFTSLDVPGSDYTNTTALTARGDIIGRYTGRHCGQWLFAERRSLQHDCIPQRDLYRGSLDE